MTLKRPKGKAKEDIPYVNPVMRNQFVKQLKTNTKQSYGALHIISACLAKLSTYKTYEANIGRQALLS